ncbi:aconitate hydratase AcnA [Myxococcota bacterium]|nr:aconitate hydratase AcnA [Myxococcota bacterium]
MDTFGARGVLRISDREYGIHRLDALSPHGLDVSRLPYSLRILLENLLRHEDGVSATAADVEALARWDPRAAPTREIAFTPARVLLQDFTGVPAVVDLAAMRQAMADLGGDPARVDPLLPVELVIDHSMQVDHWASPDAPRLNRDADYGRNRERYAFLRWGQRAFRNFRVVPPHTGIVHQVNLEHLARVVFTTDAPNGRPDAYPDTVLGTDSHTPMVNGLGVLGWGVGGIEAEAAMLGQPVTMPIPQVLGMHLVGELREGATATDLVLTVCERLRKKGVVGRFVEFFGAGLSHLPLADRATIGNMSPEYGATCAIFPIDDETLRYLRFTGRPPERVALVEAYAKEQGLFRRPGDPDPSFTEVLTLDLGEVEPCVAGPRRPHDRVPLSRVAASFGEALPGLRPPSRDGPAKGAALRPPPPQPAVGVWGEHGGPNPCRSGTGAAAEAAAATLDHGAVVIASITSCTNTSNPAVMLAAGLLARAAVARGLEVPPWVKTSLAPGSQVVTDYLRAAGLQAPLDALGFHLVGYGCATCIGNSGPLPEAISRAIAERDLVVCSVLSGNRNYEGRIHSEVRANFLMSPPLVVAYALSGRVDRDLTSEPLGIGRDGRPVYLRDVWPSREEVEAAIASSVRADMFRRTYADVYRGDPVWNSLPVPEGDLYAWDPASTYVRLPPYFQGMDGAPEPPADAIRGARALAVLGDGVTTDHISPAGSIQSHSPAGRHLVDRGVEAREFNSYGSRRGNHEVMVRGTFANVRIRNRLAPGTEGGVTRHQPSGDAMSIYDAAVRYAAEGTPLLVLAGREYGAGSSRDWAAKGPRLLGVRAVIAESYERIHRSNLVGMGILPLQFHPGETVDSLGLTGREDFAVLGIAGALGEDGRATGDVRVVARSEDGSEREFRATPRIDTAREALYYRHGGILNYALRQLLAGHTSPLPGPTASAGTPLDLPTDDETVDEGSRDSFPASDPPAY